MPRWIEGIIHRDVLGQELATLVLLVGLLILRGAVRRALQRSQLPAEVRRRWFVSVRYIGVLLFILGVVMIWAAELRTAAISFVAIAAAIVLATKELIMCLSGTILRTTSRGAALGNRIELAGIRGDVIDFGILTTTLLEVGPGTLSHQRTGRAIVLPNSVWLNTPMINETFTSDYVLHNVTIPTKPTDGESWKEQEARLLRAAQAECAPFIDEARAQIERQGKEQGLDTPTVDPKVSLRVPEPGRLDLLLRFPAPTSTRGRVEQAILRRFFDVEV